MIKVKKRKKKTRFRGSHTHGRGFKKKARGSGHRGGVGMAGTGKMADQKKTLVINLFKGDYFGKSKTLRRGKPVRKLNAINIGDINDNIDSFVKKGLAKQNKDFYEVNLENYKVLGGGDLKIKLKIKAKKISEFARKKIEAVGGEII